MEKKQLLKRIELAAKDNETQLDLSVEELRSIPLKLCQLTSLTTLNLSVNKLTSIPAELGQLGNLTTLNLSVNKLTSLPAEIGKLTNLKVLDLSGNQLTSIPAELGKLTKLRSLYLNDNQLTSIPAELGKLTKLEELKLAGNETLTSPPPEVVKQGTKAILAYLQKKLTQDENKFEKEEVKKRETKDSEPVLEAVSIAGFSISDQRAGIDSLGFKPYTTAIANFLSHKDTKPPLTMSVEGEWGSGKSSFMLQLMRKLEGTDVHTIEFSPWRHDKEEAVWAAFVLAFIDQLSEKLGWFRATMANLKLLWDRFNLQAGWPDVGKIVIKLFVYFLILSTFLVAFWAAKIPYIQSIDFPVKLLLSFASIGVLVIKGLNKAKELVGNPFEHDLKKYVEAPDYAGRIPFIERFHKDFKKIVKAYAGNKTVYVFIDDLDRCEVPKAAELMKAINLMIMEEPNLIFIIGMDRQKVAAGLAVKDEDLIRYLRPDIAKQKNDEVVGSFWLAGLRYGYDFIEKFIQLPFTLPRPTEADIDNMMASIAAKGRAVTQEERAADTTREDQDSGDQAKLNGDSTEIQESKPEEPDAARKLKEKQKIEQKQKRQMELRLADDSEQINQIVHMAVPFVGFNPRRIKQFINMFRLRAYIAYETQLLILPEDVGQTEGVTLEQLGKIVTISLRWPLLLEALSRDESLLRILSDFAEQKGRDIVTLKNEVARRWAMDNQLLELIRFGCVAGEAEPYEWAKYTLSRAKIDKLLQVSPKVRNIKLAPLEINVSSAVAAAEAVGPEVVISEQHTVGVETEDSKQLEDSKDIRQTRKKKKKATKKTSKRAGKKEVSQKMPKKKMANEEKAAKEKKAADNELSPEEKRKAELDGILAETEVEEKSDGEIADLIDKTPDQALREDWKEKHALLAPYITETGKMRGGIRPSQQKKAKKILKFYGFKDEDEVDPKQH